MLRRLWKDFLYRQRRRMSGPGGALRLTKDPVADLDMSIRELPEITGRKEGEVPIWMFGGEQEPWLLPAIPTNDHDTGGSIRIRRSIDHMEPALPENREDGCTVHGRWHDLACHRENGAPMVRYTRVEHMPHAAMTEMSFRIWEDFFSKADVKVIDCPS